MADNALVTWVQTDQPWLVEGRLIAQLRVPFNLDENRQHPFQQQLAHIRAEARALARALPIAVS